MRKKKKSERVCKYCQTWHDTPSSKRHFSSYNVVQFRKCNKIKKEVGENDEACMYFTLAKRFWCLKDIAWLETVVCLARQKNKKEGCVRCLQGRVIKKLMENK